MHGSSKYSARVGQSRSNRGAEGDGKGTRLMGKSGSVPGLCCVIRVGWVADVGESNWAGPVSSFASGAEDDGLADAVSSTWMVSGTRARNASREGGRGQRQQKQVDGSPQ